MKTISVLVAALVLLVGGYFAYDYFVVKHPPTWIIKLITKTDPPPPLPAGDAAPLIVPDGFTATIYSRETPGARVLARDPKGVLVVSLTERGKVVALPDLDSDGKADNTITILEDLRQPHGLAFICPPTGNESADQDACKLYVAETNAVKRYAYDADTYTATYEETILNLPSGKGHFTRTLLAHPNGAELLVSVGSSCNVCNEKDAKRATVLSVNLATNTSTVFARGLRNTVFMATDPVQGEVWGTDNGRDLLGDDIPPDEINVIEKGYDYGWPLCYGQNVHDSDFDKTGSSAICDGKIPAHIEIQAHSAPLGLAFIPEEGWPESMGNDLLVAYHGSWNRSVPTGYKVVRFDLDPKSRAPYGGPIGFAAGFLPPTSTDEGDAIGRPVDIIAEPGGIAYISDDRAGAIYRIARIAEE